MTEKKEIKQKPIMKGTQVMNKVEVKEKVESVKKHIKKNKKQYITGSVCLLVGTAGGGLFMLNRAVPGVGFSQKFNQVAIGHKINQVIVNLVERSTPSKPVHLKGTKLYFDSIHDAARQTGHTLTQISKNANGLIPDVNGDVFEFLQPAA